MQYLDQNDDQYEKYVQFKTGGVTNEYLKEVLRERPFSTGNDYTKPNFVDAFECLVCRRIHNNLDLKAQKKRDIKYSAKVTHYGCPKPRRFSDIPSGNLQRIDDDGWSTEWLATKFEAMVFKESLRKGKILTEKEIQKHTEVRLLDYFNRNSRRA